MIEAIVVDHTKLGPSQMLGMGDPSLLDQVTGGEYSKITKQLDTLELMLKISIAASVVAGIAGAASLFRGR